MRFLEFSPGFASKVFKFKDPDTGYEYFAPSKKALLSHIRLYREQNELSTIEHLQEVVDNYLCNLPENTGACRTCKLHRGFMSYINGGIALLEFVLFGKENTVDQQTADARAAQCVNCPLNQFPDKGPFIRYTDMVAEKCTDGLRSKHHDQLGNCVGCTCVLKAKVFFKGPFKLSQQEIKDITAVKPDCWQLRLGTTK